MYLDAAYALLVEDSTLIQQGVGRSEITEQLDKKLAEVLPEELSPMEAEMERRRKIAEENQAAMTRVAAMMKMPRRGDPGA